MGKTWNRGAIYIMYYGWGDAGVGDVPVETVYVVGWPKEDQHGDYTPKLYNPTERNQLSLIRTSSLFQDEPAILARAAAGWLYSLDAQVMFLAIVIYFLPISYPLLTHPPPLVEWTRK